MPETLVGDIQIRQEHQRSNFRPGVLKNPGWDENSAEGYGHVPWALAVGMVAGHHRKVQTVPSVFSTAPGKTLAENAGEGWKCESRSDGLINRLAGSQK